MVYKQLVVVLIALFLSLPSASAQTSFTDYLSSPIWGGGGTLSFSYKTPEYSTCYEEDGYKLTYCDPCPGVGKVNCMYYDASKQGLDWCDYMQPQTCGVACICETPEFLAAHSGCDEGKERCDRTNTRPSECEGGYWRYKSDDVCSDSSCYMDGERATCKTFLDDDGGEEDETTTTIKTTSTIEEEEDDDILTSACSDTKCNGRRGKDCRKTTSGWAYYICEVKINPDDKDESCLKYRSLDYCTKEGWGCDEDKLGCYDTKSESKDPSDDIPTGTTKSETCNDPDSNQENPEVERSTVKLDSDSRTDVCIQNILNTDTEKMSLIKEYYCKKDSDGKYTIASTDILCSSLCYEGACTTAAKRALDGAEGDWDRYAKVTTNEMSSATPCEPRDGICMVKPSMFGTPAPVLGAGCVGGGTGLNQEHGYAVNCGFKKNTKTDKTCIYLLEENNAHEICDDGKWNNYDYPCVFAKDSQGDVAARCETDELKCGCHDKGKQYAGGTQSYYEACLAGRLPQCYTEVSKKEAQDTIKETEQKGEGRNWPSIDEPSYTYGDEYNTGAGDDYITWEKEQRIPRGKFIGVPFFTQTKIKAGGQTEIIAEFKADKSAYYYFGAYLDKVGTTTEKLSFLSANSYTTINWDERFCEDDSIYSSNTKIDLKEGQTATLKFYLEPSAGAVYDGYVVWFAGCKDDKTTIADWNEPAVATNRLVVGISGEKQAEELKEETGQTQEDPADTKNNVAQEATEDDDKNPIDASDPCKGLSGNQGVCIKNTAYNCEDGEIIDNDDPDKGPVGEFNCDDLTTGKGVAAPGECERKPKTFKGGKVGTAAECSITTPEFACYEITKDSDGELICKYKKAIDCDSSKAIAINKLQDNTAKEGDTILVIQSDSRAFYKNKCIDYSNNEAVLNEPSSSSSNRDPTNNLDASGGGNNNDDTQEGSATVDIKCETECKGAVTECLDSNTMLSCGVFEKDNPCKIWKATACRAGQYCKDGACETTNIPPKTIDPVCSNICGIDSQGQMMAKYSRSEWDGLVDDCSCSGTTKDDDGEGGGVFGDMTEETLLYIAIGVGLLVMGFIGFSMLMDRNGNNQQPPRRRK